MNRIVGAIAIAFFLSMLSSCSQDYSPPASQSKPQTGASRDTDTQRPPVTSKSESSRAVTSEGTAARKADTLPTGKATSATAPSATDDKRGSASDRSGVASDRGSPDQGRAGVTTPKSVGDEIAGNRMQTIEGVLLKIDGDSYLVKDLSGNEVKLRADNKTKKDGNLTVGDRILAQLEGPGVVASSITKR